MIQQFLNGGKSTLPGQGMHSGVAVPGHPLCGQPWVGTFRNFARIIQDPLKAEPEIRMHVVDEDSDNRKSK